MLGNPAIDLGPVMAGRGGEKPYPVLDRAALGIARAVIEPADTGEGQRRGAHGARLQRDIGIAIGEAFGAERGGGLAQRQHFGMGGRVVIGERAVVGAGDDPRGGPLRDHAADRHVAMGRGGTGLFESRLHQ